MLDHIDHLAHLGRVHELLTWVRGRIVDAVGLKVDDLLTLIDLILQLSGLLLQLGVLLGLVLDVLEELLLLL